jgi:PTH1 family peptidyl-tRNA hydrolase
MAVEFKPETIKLVVGLGNPGTRYRHTAHNAGRAVTLMLANIPETEFRTSQWFCAHRGSPFTFVLPETFMNESGIAVKAALHAFRAKPSACLVIHDDSDLPLGTFRIQYGRGAAGHHGVESVIRMLGTKDFWRLRLGVQPTPLKRERADAFVLKPMSRKTREILAATAEAVRTILAPHQTLR